MPRPIPFLCASLSLTLLALGCTSNTTPTDATVNTQPAPESKELVDTVDHSGHVLRHAVFFSFKESSSEDDVQSVVDAFRGLPAKIPAIVDFQSGTNNSPEGLDDGLTHCFLLTFKDKAGLEDYVPHKAHAGDFADVLRPHMDKVFVFDYWGTPYDAMEKELKHAVFFKFKDDASPEDVKKVEDAFAALPEKIDTIKKFEWGKAVPGEDKEDGFTHCFMVTFDSEDGRATYLPHAEHEAFVEVLKPHLDKVRVLDFWGERVGN